MAATEYREGTVPWSIFCSSRELEFGSQINKLQFQKIQDPLLASAHTGPAHCTHTYTQANSHTSNINEINLNK